MRFIVKTREVHYMKYNIETDSEEKAFEIFWKHKPENNLTSVLIKEDEIEIISMKPETH